MREPETLKELKAEILRQLEKSETVTIILTEGDGIHELLESITDGIKGTEELNRQCENMAIRFFVRTQYRLPTRSLSTPTATTP